MRRHSAIYLVLVIACRPHSPTEAGEVTWAQRANIDRSSAGRVTLGNGSVVIAGTTSQHRHVHGGGAARIASATFVAINGTAAPVRVEVLGIEYLVDSQCGLPNEVRARPRLMGVSGEDLAPGEGEIVVVFETQGAYQVHCDRFATRVTFRVGGSKLVAAAEHEVTRFAPLRH